MWPLIIALGCSALNVFVVPHSHIDAGWLITVDDYYTKHAMQVLKNIIILLEEKPSMKFIWSEAIYMQRFLVQYPENIPKLKAFISEGRLEIVGGGWIMNDEALVDFEGLTRQILAGHRFFKEVLEVPNITIAWQIDPFGHSSLTPSIFEQMGFDYMVMNRIDEDFRVIFTQEELRSSKDMEFLWRAHGLGASRGIFTHILYKHYDLPDFFNPKSKYKCFSRFPANKMQIDRW